MTTQKEWREVGKLPRGVALAEGGMVKHQGAWWHLGAGKVYRLGAGGNSTVGMQQGDAAIVPAAYAEQLASGWVSADPNPNSSDVFDLVTPGSDISGITDTVYVQFKDPPAVVEMWKYEPANGAGYFKAGTVNQAQTTVQPPPGGPGGPGGPIVPAPATATSAFMKALPWVAGAGAVAALGYVGYRMLKKHRRRH
jgi:hypothetical protein